MCSNCTLNGKRRWWDWNWDIFFPTVKQFFQVALFQRKKNPVSEMIISQLSVFQVTLIIVPANSVKNQAEKNLFLFSVCHYQSLAKNRRCPGGKKGLSNSLQTLFGLHLTVLPWPRPRTASEVKTTKSLSSFCPNSLLVLGLPILPSATTSNILGGQMC